MIRFAHIRRCLVLAGLLVAAAPVLAVAPGSSFPTNVRLNQDNPGTGQFETSQAVDPRNPRHIVAAWMNRVGHLQTLATAVTRDGGLHWRARILPNLPELTVNNDPSLAVDRKGDFYLGDIAFDENGDNNHFLLYKSTNGGENFALFQDLPYVSFADKDWLMVDPITDALYVFWTDFVPGGNDVLSVMFRKSVDGGATFSDPVSISDPDFDAIAAVSSSGPNGELYVSFFNFSDHIFINRSLDGGATWLPRPPVVEGNMIPPSLYRGGLAGLPAHAVDLSRGPHRGRLYAVWPDARTDRSDIMLRHSDDRGDTWSDPVRVSDTSIGDDVAAANPWVAVDDAGRVHVTFLGLTGRFSFQKLATFMATSTDGGLSFAPNVRISDGYTTYFPNDDFIGDYNQMIVADGLLHPIWSDARLGDSDIFTQLLPVNYLGGP